MNWLAAAITLGIFVVFAIIVFLGIFLPGALMIVLLTSSVVTFFWVVYMMVDDILNED